MSGTHFPLGSAATQMPADARGVTIPLLPFKGIAHKITATATSARNASAISADVGIVTVATTADVWMRTGDNTITADDAGTDGASTLVMAGAMIDFILTEAHRHIAFKAVSDEGIVVISERGI